MLGKRRDGFEVGGEDDRVLKWLDSADQRRGNDAKCAADRLGSADEQVVRVDARLGEERCLNRSDPALCDDDRKPVTGGPAGVDRLRALHAPNTARRR